MNFIEECNVVIDRLDPFSFKMIQNEIQECQPLLTSIESKKSHDQVFALAQRNIEELQCFQLPKTKILIQNNYNYPYNQLNYYLKFLKTIYCQFHTKNLQELFLLLLLNSKHFHKS